MTDNKQEFGFKRILLRKDQPLGTGSYGAVCKATCDQLLCAAKIMLPTLFDLSNPREKAALLAKFEQECKLLGAVKHPNIVQYLGTWREPATGHLVLLMELCDESLTKHLKNCPPLTYQLQVDISHDVAVALAYLHSNGLIHRDLSSNNVLLMSGKRAKVTDFGMSKFEQVNPRMTPLTLCPGTLVYMSPEALEEPPQYGSQLDCFSWGVLVIQIITQMYPDPGPRFQTVVDPRYPENIRVPVLDVSRRQTHIALVESTHPLLSLSTKCLSYKAENRPPVPAICEKLLELKQASTYHPNIELPTGERIQEGYTSVQKVENRNSDLAKRVIELEKELGEAHNLVLELQNTLAERDKEIKKMAEEMHKVKMRLQLSEQSVHPKERVEGQVEKKELNHQVSLNVTWREGGKVPSEMLRGGTVVDGDIIYCYTSNRKVIQAYNITTGRWLSLPRCSHAHFGLAVINGFLTTVGGYNVTTNSDLYSLIGSAEKQQWSKVYPSMPTRRCNAAVVCAEKALIVAGGDATGSNDNLKVVELMDIETQKWCIVNKLPYPQRLPSAAVHNGKLYLAGGYSPVATKAIYACSLPELLQSSRKGKLRAISYKKTSVWHEISELPVSLSTIAVFHGHLLAIGGEDNARKPTTAVHEFDVETDSWIVVSQMNIGRNRSLVAVSSDDQLIVMGGSGGGNTTEIATST